MSSLRVLTAIFLGAFCIVNIPNSHASAILDLPYLATVEVNGEYKCTGAIIDDIYIISSQACTGSLDVNSTEVYVRVGTDKLGFRGSVLRVVDINPDTAMGTDLSLVKVATPFEYTNRVMWVNFNNAGITEGSVGVIGVWKSQTKKSTLMSVPVSVISTDTCTKLYSGTFSVNSTVACIMPTLSYKNFCRAHLGAPFYLDEQVFGVVSYNPGCEDSTLPLVVTMLGGYGSYIISTMCGIQNLMA